MYEYAASLIKVVDGDTVDMDVDLGMDVHVRTRFRLIGVNAAEHGTPSGDTATAWVKAWFAANEGHLVVRTTKDKKEKYGRYLADVVSLANPDEVSLCAQLLTSGHALSWDGKGVRPV